VRLLRASLPQALMVTWMLVLLFNVDRTRERFYPGRRPAWLGDADED
jgi:hypothetical protein